LRSASERGETVGISLDGAWKKFRTGETPDSLRDLIPALFSAGARGSVRGPDLAPREFWAVRDVSFSVGPGEVLGIIGPNGAGKSTILKLLTRVLRPTRGRVVTRGRLGALIEIAAGFHPDLTGRENIFLQGAILGMPAAETARKFDAIVEFAGVAAFIDTPVKRYSTGMNARLGFAIAAHLEPDALITDEVLAVGDFAFQEKAFGRLAELAAAGIPVVVVSHQLDRVAKLCNRAIVLDRGAVVRDGTPADCISWYTQRSAEAPEGASPEAAVVLSSLSLGATAVRSGTDLSFRVAGDVRSADALREIEVVGVRLRSTGSGEVVSVTSSTRCGVHVAGTGAFEITGELQLNVSPGVYLVEVHPWDNRGQRTTQQSLVASVTVLEGASFVGRVQLNARMRLAAGPASTA